MANGQGINYGLLADAFSALGGKRTNFGQTFEKLQDEQRRKKLLESLVLDGTPASAPVAPPNTSVGVMPPNATTPSAVSPVSQLDPNVAARPSLTNQQRQIIAAMPVDQGLQTAATLLGKTYTGAPVQIEFKGRQLSFNSDDPRLVQYLNAGAVLLDKGVNPVMQKEFEREEKLSRQYTGETDVKSYKGIRDAYDRLNSAFTIQGTTPEARAQADLSMVIAYMKMLDPGSVVREGEQEMARQTAGISDQLFNTYKKVKTGEFLTEQQRTGFMLNAQQIRQDVEGNLVSTNTSYRDRAKRYGVNPSFILSPKEYEEVGIPDMTPPPEKWLQQKPEGIDPTTWAGQWLRLSAEERKIFEQ